MPQAAEAVRSLKEPKEGCSSVQGKKEKEPQSKRNLRKPPPQNLNSMVVEKHAPAQNKKKTVYCRPPKPISSFSTKEPPNLDLRSFYQTVKIQSRGKSYNVT